MIKTLEDARIAIMKKKKETEEKIADLLDGKQKEKFEEMKKQHGSRFDKRPEHGE